MSSTPGPSPFSNREYNLLKEFSRKAWGDPECFLKKTGDIEYINLDKYLTPIELFFFGTDLSLILVRDEYRLALTVSQHAQYTKGAYVTGQPGIDKYRTMCCFTYPWGLNSTPGKTFFLVYLLVYLLGQKIAVALQLPTESYAFFSGEGVSIQSTTVAEPIDKYQGSIWGLCDSNHLITTPSILFHRWRCMRVILTSPKISRWKEWAKQTGAEQYVMDIWSIEEVKKLAAMSDRTVERMAELARKWGGVPRTILKYYSKPDNEAEQDYRRMAKRAVRECRMTLEQGAELDLSDGVPSSFFFIQPRDGPKGRFTEPYIFVPTRTLRRLLAEAL